MTDVKARAHLWYTIDMENGVFKFNRRYCPRCGSIMAFHKEPSPRWHCGKCNYTIFETGSRGGTGGGKGRRHGASQ
ncbi:MAG: 30S ribosomal protein S27ae [Thermocladium sp.]